MLSLYDDVLAVLRTYNYCIAGVSVRKPYEETPKTYPALVVHEVANLPASHATVTGEGRTALAYQVDIQTQNCVDKSGTVLGSYDAGRRLAKDVTDALNALKITRRSITHRDVASDVLEHVWRGECVADSYGFSYRR